MSTAGLLLPHLRAGLGSILTVAAIVLTLAAGAVFAPIAVTGMLDASKRGAGSTVRSARSAAS